MFLDEYYVNEQTLAILPARHIDYQSIVFEKTRKLHVRKTPLDLIKIACFLDWTTYEGRRQAVMYHAKYKHKVPIPIFIDKGIIAFPTHSPKDVDCQWIFSNHVLRIDDTDQHQTLITFSNGNTHLIDVSAYIIKKQYERAIACLTYNQFLPT